MQSVDVRGKDFFVASRRNIKNNIASLDSVHCKRHRPLRDYYKALLPLGRQEQVCPFLIYQNSLKPTIVKFA